MRFMGTHSILLYSHKKMLSGSGSGILISLTGQKSFLGPVPYGHTPIQFSLCFNTILPQLSFYSSRPPVSTMLVTGLPPYGRSSFSQI